MLQQINFLARITGVAAALSLSLLPPANAQLTEQEFQMGRAREACRNQALQQQLTFNRVVSTQPISGSGGQMIGSEVILNVSRGGATYDVRCSYDNATRTATILGISDPGEPSGGASVPTEGNFIGRGLASGSVFGFEREADASLSFNANGFSLSVSVPPGTVEQVYYGGRITRLRGAGSANSFTLEGRVLTFASSANDLQVISTTGTCQIEVFDARIISTNCNTDLAGSASRFAGMQQF